MSDEAINFSIFRDAGLAVRSFKTGETIVKEGDPASELLLHSERPRGNLPRRPLASVPSTRTAFSDKCR